MNVRLAWLRMLFVCLALSALSALARPVWSVGTPVSTPAHTPAPTPAPTMQSTPQAFNSAISSGALNQLNSIPYPALLAPPAGPPAAPANLGPNPTPSVPLDLPGLPLSALGPAPSPTPELGDDSGRRWWKKNSRLLELDAADIAPTSISGSADTP